MERRGVALPIVLVAVVLAIAVGTGAAVVWRTRYFDSALPAAIKDFLGIEEPPTESSTEIPSETPDDLMKDWKTYTNEELGFSFKYPGDWVESEHQFGIFSVESKGGNIGLSLYKDFQGGREHWSRAEEKTYSTEGGSTVFTTAFYGEDDPNVVAVDGVFYPDHPEISFIYGFNLRESPDGFLILELILSTFNFF